MCGDALHARNDEPTQLATIEPDEVLALAADVEHAAAERERDREPGQDQRRRQQQRLLRLYAARRRGVASSRWKNQFRPAPLKMSR